MKSPEYWRKREEKWQDQQIKDDKKRMNEILKRLQYAQDEIQKEIEAQWQQFSNGQKITISEAMKRSDKMDIEAFARKAKKYVETKDFSDKANQELKLYNITMRVNRLELLKANIGLELISTFDELDTYFSNELSQAALAEFERQAGILGLTVPKNGYAAAIKQIVNDSFQTADFPTFSDNLWQYQAELKSDLDKLLVRSITQGINPKQLAPQLKKLMTDEGRENARYNSQRLMITETSRVQMNVQKDSYGKADVKQYEYIAEPSACPTCAALDGKIFNVDDMQPGENANPMHPFCKCSTAPYVDDKAFYDDLLRRKVITPDEYKQAFDDRSEADKAIAELSKERKGESVNKNNEQPKANGKTLDELMDGSNMREQWGEERYKAFADHFDKMGNTPIKELYQKLGNKIQFENIEANKKNANHAINNNVTVSKDSFVESKRRNALNTVYHEIGHALDNLGMEVLTGKKSLSTGTKIVKRGSLKVEVESDYVRHSSALPKYNLKETIRRDLWKHVTGEDEMMEDLGSKPRKKSEKEVWSQRRSELYEKELASFKNFYSELKELDKQNPKKYTELSDILDAQNFAGYSYSNTLGFGHGSRYWQSVGHTETEFFTEYLATFATNSDGRKLLETIFPNATKTVLQIVDDILKG